MIRWRRIVWLSAALSALLAPAATAASSPYARAALVSCDSAAREAVFEGRVTTYRRAPRMQMRFTLQAQTPGSTRWRRVDAPGWRTWINAPANLGRYTYTKTVQELIAPASYRAVIEFRWRDRGGRTIRSERAISRVCRQADDRPDLYVRSVGFADGTYTAVITNRGRQAAGPFAVEFVAGGGPLGTAEVNGLAPRSSVTVRLAGPPCDAGRLVEAIADARAQVEEADEFDNALRAPC